jgi:hypothetical protein
MSNQEVSLGLLSTVGALWLVASPVSVTAFSVATGAQEARSPRRTTAPSASDACEFFIMVIDLSIDTPGGIFTT